MEGSRKTVLIIEDDAVMRGVCKEKLESEGFRVLEAADGATGLDMADSNQPDLVVLDNRMPNMSGFQMLTRLRAMGGWGASAPVLFFSNIEPASDEETNDIESLHPAGYLVKSDTDLDALVSKIRSIIG